MPRRERKISNLVIGVDGTDKDGLTIETEIFATPKEARAYAEELLNGGNKAKLRVIEMLPEAVFREDDGSLNYDDCSDTFGDSMKIKYRNN